MNEKLKRYHQSIDWHPGDDLDESNFEDADEQAVGFWIARDKHPIIYVVGWESKPFQITFRYDMTKEIASRLDEETARKYANPVEGVDDKSIEEWAAINILDGVSEGDSNDIDFRLRDILSSYPVLQEPYYTRQGRIKGFSASRYIFPEEENFTVSNYADELFKLITVGQQAQWFLDYTYELGFGQHGSFELIEESNDLIS